MDKEPNKNNEPNEEAKVLSDEELEGIVGGGYEHTTITGGMTMGGEIATVINPISRESGEMKRIMAEMEQN